MAHLFDKVHLILAAPRSSQKFGTFVLIGYPTPAQREEGFTGGAIGIHGPHRQLEWLGSLNNVLDTTDGCIGLATDEEMDQLSAWIRKSKASRIVIR
jgi:murein L,D-transpeptidase YafK